MEMEFAHPTHLSVRSPAAGFTSFKPAAPWKPHMWQRQTMAAKSGSRGQTIKVAENPDVAQTGSVTMTVNGTDPCQSKRQPRQPTNLL